LIVLLTEGYTWKPISTTSGVTDSTYGKSALRITYASRTESSFSFLESDVAYLDGTAIDFSTLGDLLTDAYGQLVTGHKRAVFDIVKTALVPSAKTQIPCSLGAVIHFTLGVAGGLVVETSLTALKDNEGVVYGFEWGDLDEVQDENSYGRAFILPKDSLSISVSVMGGVYLDKSFPLLVRDYEVKSVFGDGSSNVRSPIDYTLSNLPAWGFSEKVQMVARRPRRFTDVLKGLVEGVSSLRYVYEPREGLVLNLTNEGEGVYVLTPKQVNYLIEEDTDGTDTQIGNFSDVVEAGDHVFIDKEDGTEALYLRVVGVVDGELTCSWVRGSSIEDAYSFKVKTRVGGLIPQLQSFDEYFEKGFEVLYETSAQEGISVPLEGKLVDTNADFLALGVLVGDYLVIDPQGALLDSSPTEYGYPPRGDQGKLGEVGYIEGEPHELDDNRGSYRVLEVGLDYLLVSGSVGSFERSFFNFLPSVAGDLENPLRVTAGVSEGSYAYSTSESVHPFSYRIVRLRNPLPQGVAEDFLFYRERTLSWAERVRAFNGFPTEMGSWAIYEAEGYMEQAGVGDKTHPSNDVLLDSVKGLTELKPFVNTSTSLSVLDRRVMIEDPLLLGEGYFSDELESGLPSDLEAGLDEFSARVNRSSWIAIRTHRTKGTLSKMETTRYPKMSSSELVAFSGLNNR
jgi:hypothetical protein